MPSSGMGRFNGVCLGYVPTSYRNLHAALRLTQFKQSDVLLDFGCGLGRVVIEVARRRQIRRVIGIDISDVLVEIARQNVAMAGDKLLSKVYLEKTDATVYVVPDDVSIVFFFNPFEGHVFDRVLSNLRRSFDRTTRDLRIICVIPPEGGALFLEQIMRSEWLQLKRSRELLGGWKCLLFEARAVMDRN